MFVVAAAIAAVQGWRAWQALRVMRDIQFQSQQQAPRTDPSATRPVTTASPATEPAYAADAAAIAKLARFDIAGVLANIEAAKVPGIRVVSIEMAAIESTTRVEIESPDQQAVIQYLAKLNNADKSHRWGLMRTQLLQNSSITATIIAAEYLTDR